MSGRPVFGSDMQTVDLQQAVPGTVTSPMQEMHTQPFQTMNPAIKARLEAQAARNMAFQTAELQAEVAVTAPIARETSPFAPSSPHSSGADTVPFTGGETAPMPVSRLSTGPYSGDATVPFRQTSSLETAPFAAQETIQFDESSGAQTVPFGAQETIQFGQQSRLDTAPDSRTAIWEQKSTGSLQGSDSDIGYTGIMGESGSVTGSLGDDGRTVRLGEDSSTRQITVGAEIESLRAQLNADPGDTDTALELALALNEAGERTEAHQILTELAAMFDAHGEFEQAGRIRLMIGDAGTAPMPQDSSATQPMPRQTTDSLKPRTGTLNLRSVPASRDGRIVAQKRTDERERTVFPARDVTFTESLPQIDRLKAPAAAFFEAAEVDRAAGRYKSALDNLQMALAEDPSVPSVFLRTAEIQLKLGYRRKALDTIEALQQFETLFRSGVPDWTFSRLRLHAEPFDLTKVQRLVDTMIREGQAPVAAPYVARLIEHLVLGDRISEATEYADRICGLAPGETRSTLEAALLSIHAGDKSRAVERWEFALRNGADPIVGRASMAALVAETNEADHWRLMFEVIPAWRAKRDPLLADAYRRTAEAAGLTSIHRGAMSLFLSAKPGSAERATLASAAGDRAGSPVGRAAAAASLAHLLQAAGRGDEYLAAIRTTLNLFTDDRVPENVNWAALLGFTPTVDEMSYELGQELIRAGDAAGAVDVLKQGYALNKSHTKLTQALAEAFARTNQLGSALTILDELAMTHRKAGHLDEMAAVLRQMSQLAPANIKVKSRLVDAYLQRGFVAEARAELIQRADLEERAGMTKEAIISLQRAADLSWNLGFPQESFNLYDRILALDPEDVGNRSALVNLYLQVGRLSDAAEHQRAVVDLALTHGRKHEAIAALHQVIGLTPDDMTAYYQLGEALASMGEYQQAEKVYRRIVLMNPDDAIAQAKATTMAALKEQTSRA
jgi:tetratricopeptide (TPR) repeat protein